jgi:adsorption protein B
LDTDLAAWLLERATHEFVLFAAVGVLLGGLDDLLIDLLWIARWAWRRIAVYTRHARADADTIAPAERRGRIAVFVPAWRESAVIGPMLRTALARWAGCDVRIFVGCYPNDPATITAVDAVADPRVRCVVGPVPGGTTKAGNLNTMWRALLADEAHDGVRFKAVALHDAEDVVHPAEIAVFDRLIERFDMVQLPVLPLIDPASRWISATYADEFVEAHGKAMVVREAVGAGVPSAGVGCALSRDMLARIAQHHGGDPFDPGSLTEDYELGLRLRAMGGRAAFVRLPGSRTHGMVAVRAYFPGSFDAAVTQKSRWIVGIALSGWDRLGWSWRPAELWMRLRDRRALLAAVVTLAAYVSLVLVALDEARSFLTGPTGLQLSSTMQAILWINLALLVWRAAMRFGFVARGYGWREGVRSIPRMVVGNIIAMAAARRAVVRYAQMRRRGSVEWDHTRHDFPAELPAA